MGNSDSIPEDVSARFATCEIECISEKFTELAKAGSFRGKTFNTNALKNAYLSKHPEMAEMIFAGFDIDGNKKVDLSEFIQGLCHCTRGSKEERHKFLFSMFDKTNKRKISRKDFSKGIHSSYIAGKEESDSEKKKRVASRTNEVFNKYDINGDGYLTLPEFLKWASEAPEVEKFEKLFASMDKAITTRSAGAASVISYTHETHVGLTDTGNLTIDNIPPSWVELFKQAGATDKELEDSHMVITLMGIVAEKLSQKASLLKAASGSNIDINNDNKPKSSQQTDNIPPPPTVEAPPPPTIAPPPPSVAPPEIQNKPISANLLDGIKQGTDLKHVEPNTQKKSSSSFLDDIKKKPQLNHVNPDDLDKMSHEDRHDLTSVLARAILQHRNAMNVDENGNEINDDDAWDDEDDE